MFSPKQNFRFPNLLNALVMLLYPFDINVGITWKESLLLWWLDSLHLVFSVRDVDVRRISVGFCWALSPHTLADIICLTADLLLGFYHLMERDIFLSSFLAMVALLLILSLTRLLLVNNYLHQYFLYRRAKLVVQR